MTKQSILIVSVQQALQLLHKLVNITLTRQAAFAQAVQHTTQPIA